MVPPPPPPKQKKKSRDNPRTPPTNARSLKRKRETDTIESLVSRIEELDTSATYDEFSSLPLSKPTSSGLHASHFRTTTDIQKSSIPLALKGRDILGAAKTGSGKTLAFVVPVLEKLYREQWGEEHGLAALVLSPTRELAIQIFEVLRKVGRYHTFSAGLVIGGRSLQEERERLGRMNILVCTPGRILQHMDQNADLDLGNLKMLVLDEADRIMDMGFQSTVDAIVEHLPKERQTMLFSATQTKKVSDLARLSLREPEYVSVHQASENATPATLKQNYVVTPLPEKLDTLWSFLRSNTKSKILVFLSSGKQVRFVFETFRALQPGIPLMHLHGRQKQTARHDITQKFSGMKHACLFATDVVARGLDFPSVDWVIQVDCPEDADTYIHRVGRTARYERDGSAVLFLDPSEEPGMVKRFEQKKIPVGKINVRANKQQSIRPQLQERCFRDPDIKYLGQKAFISYVRSIHVQHDKEVFKVQDLPLEEFATSLGLPGAPRIKFQRGVDVKAIKNRSRAKLSSDEEDEGDANEKAVRTKYDRMFERQNNDILAPHREKLYSAKDRSQRDNDDSDDDFLAVKRRLSDVSVETKPANDKEPAKDVIIRTAKGEEIPVDSKRREKMLASKKAMLKFKEKGRKVVFDEDGNSREIYEFDDEDAFRARGAPDALRKEFVDREAAKVLEQDVADKEAVRDKKRERKEKVKAKLRAAAAGEDDGGDVDGGVPLVPFEDPFSGNSDEDGEERDAEQKHGERKWFQKDESDEETNRPRKRNRGLVEDAETLEDLEALAQSLL